MGNPFRDSFLKAGLVSKKQVNKAKKEAHQKKTGKGDASPSDVSKKVQEQRAKQAKKNRELNQKRAEEKQRREQKAQVKQLIEQNRLEQDRDGEAYHFVVENKIMRVFVTEEMIDQLFTGSLAVVKLGDSFDVIPAKVARQIGERMEDAVVVLHKK